MTAMPVRYSLAVEKPIDNEEQVHRDLIDTMRSITETTSKDYGQAVRSVHAKAHDREATKHVLPKKLRHDLHGGAES